MKTNLVCATLVLLAIIAAVVAGCVVSDSAWPLIVLVLCDFNLPHCTVVNPTTFVLSKEETKENKEESNKDPDKEDNQ